MADMAKKVVASCCSETKSSVETAMINQLGVDHVCALKQPNCYSTTNQVLIPSINSLTYVEATVWKHTEKYTNSKLIKSWLANVQRFKARITFANTRCFTVHKQ